MAGFISALIKQRRDAKKAEPDTNGRLREILGVLRKHDYSGGITPEIIADILQDLGPTFVKIGQIASQQAEYIPPDYCEALIKLRSHVAPMDLETVNAQIEKYLGKPTNEIFKSFSDKPLGSASIGQVHRAELTDGTVVAVKVRRPGVVDTVARDFALIEKILDTFVKSGEIGGIDVKSLILELEQTSKAELDFTNEANNLDKFRANNEGREQVVIPKCYRELTCEAVLTEDFVIGTEVGDVDFIATIDDEERERIAALIADNFATQVLTDGFYHADPHSGNVFIKAPFPREATAETTAQEKTEGDSEESAEQTVQLPDHPIEWIDFGMMGTLSAKQRQLLIDMVTCVVMQDAYGLKNAVLQVAKPKGEINHGGMLDMCQGMCSQYNGSDFGDFDLGDLLGTILSGLQEENFKIDPFLTNLARGITAIEGTIKTLSPKVNILNYFISKVDTGLDFNLKLENPGEMNPEIAKGLLKFLRGVTDSSAKTAEALDMLEKGQLKIRTDFSFEEKALHTVDRLAGYAIRALLIVGFVIGACMLISSSAIISAGTDFTIAFRAIGCIIFGVSVFYAFRLYNDMKKGK